MFVHYFDPHLPYAPPPGYDDLFNKGYEGVIRNPFDLSGFSKARPKMFEEMKVLTDEDWVEIIDLYDGEIVYVDKAFGDFVRGIEERGLRDNTVIIMLSDHGEEFFEHGGFEHGHSLYDELIRVPLIISLPGKVREGVRIRNQVRLLDITPTVFDLLGLEPRPHFEGVSLVPFLTGEGSVEPSVDKILPDHIAYSEAIRIGGEQKAVTARPHKCIYRFVSEEREFYNLEEDPGETNNLFPGGGSLELLQSSLVRTVFEVSATWYIELAGDGKPHVYDIEVVAERWGWTGRIYLTRLVEPDGEIIEIESLESSPAGATRLEIKGLEVKNRALLAFKVDPDIIPLKFDLRIDGESALPHTYLGSSLARPEEMPFEQNPKRHKIKARGEPTRRPPEAPYVSVWVSEPVFRGERALVLNKDTERELRSIGYIQ